MTNWIPEIPAGAGPLYMRLAEKIARDILSGALAAKTKLPPQRDLAYDLGVTVGTVGRAYALVRKRGLVSGEVGRGTYVLGSAEQDNAAAPEHTGKMRAQPADSRFSGFDREADKWLNIEHPAPLPDYGFGSTRVASPPEGIFRLDSTSAPDVGQGQILEELLPRIAAEMPNEIASYTRTVPDRWREAGQRWLSRGGWTPEAASIVPTFGAQAAIMSAISAVTAPGDRLVFEELTYSSVARGARFSGRQSVQVTSDKEGPLPDSLDSVCKQTHPKAIFLMPTMHNPTLATISEARRIDLLEVIRRHNLWIIEDEVYGALRPNTLTPFAKLAPERTFHVGSLSKAVAAGLRGGWISCPPQQTQRLFTAHKMLTGGSSFLLSEASSRLVNSGQADRLRQAILLEIRNRYEIASEILRGSDMVIAPDAPFIWLKLPEPWQPGTFKAAAAEAGVLIDDEDEFRTGRASELHYRVRIATTNPKTCGELADGMQRLSRILADNGACYDSVA
ncbi:PLP-dependent aminotransferase family protein [Roseibium sp.]|uniref:aminotransferase-like domain-containing protein n=1 Tax=Roseibium sp. TaxID=1936156 RepID=UPI003A98546A